ncbi:unnamed protein product [Bemisia tabaci]|uniref:HECT-type E3 ubiquitin transferase n=1 Tax=Bemisia tabaci TaxID=7038 RepID=A0A9P0F1A5_BEMTA|nr:unnamed protein product [Bemisia tabaci]
MYLVPNEDLFPEEAPEEERTRDYDSSASEEFQSESSPERSKSVRSTSPVGTTSPERSVSPERSPKQSASGEGQRAPQSPPRPVLPPSVEAATTLREVLDGLASQINSEDKFQVMVSRDEGVFKVVGSSAADYFLPHHKADFHKKLQITFDSELGQDGGGLTREFFQLAVNEIKKSSLFLGKDKEKIIRNNTMAELYSKFFSAGAIMGMALLYGCSFPDYLCPTLTERILTGTVTTPTIYQIQSEQLRKELTCLKAAGTTEAAKKVMMESEILISNGYSEDSFQDLRGRDTMIDGILHHHCINKVEDATNQFLDGLAVLSVLPATRLHPGLFRPLLSNNVQKLNVNSFLQIFNVQRSAMGSIPFTVEERIWRRFIETLQKIENGETSIELEDILVFCTGLEKEPPFGFPSRPEILFNHRNPAQNYPEAGDCNMTLTLPIKYKEPTQLDMFLGQFIYGITEGRPYGVA